MLDSTWPLPACSHTRRCAIFMPLCWFVPGTRQAPTIMPLVSCTPWKTPGSLSARVGRLSCSCGGCATTWSLPTGLCLCKGRYEPFQTYKVRDSFSQQICLKGTLLVQEPATFTHIHDITKSAGAYNKFIMSGISLYQVILKLVEAKLEIRR